MINTLIPNNIACEFSYENRDTSEVHIDEIKLIQNAPKSRQLEFLNGRNNAHLALQTLQFNSPKAILIGKNREPLWPISIVGSITHCEGYCAAVVAYKKNIIGVGIDAELNSNLSDKLTLTTQTINEINKNKSLVSMNKNICVNKLIFSAKESAFKFIHSFIQEYINFNVIEISLNFDTKSFSIIFIKQTLIAKFKNSKLIGKFDYNETHIVTCVYELATD